jgi:multidrug efflux system membrane fusion protein
MAEGQLPVEALTPDGKNALDTGKVVVIDNQVDQTTGTVKVKGEFPNTNLQLWPGQFVNVRVLIDTLRNVVVVPTAAIQRGPNGAFVYVLKDDNTVTVRRVKLTQQDDVRAVVGTGLQAGERVITTGLCPPHRGDPGHGVERGERRAGHAEVRPPRRRNPRHPAQAKGASVVRARHRRPHAMSVSSPSSAAHRNIAARGSPSCSADPRLSVAAGVLAAAGRFPHHPGHDPASGREPRRDGRR